MKPEDTALVAALVKVRAGVLIDRAKTYQMESALAPLARREGFPGIAELLGAVRDRRDERLGWAVVEAMLPADTCFFRDTAPFTYLAEEVLPRLFRARGDRPVRIWSAACGSGQEAYSLAILLEEMRREGLGLNAQLFASDLSERALEKARSGLYTQFEIQRGLPIRQLIAFFDKSDEMWQAGALLRQRIRWRRFSLLADTTGMGGFDLILCRNVLGGFEEAVRRRVLDGLANLLPADGCLLLGQGETVGGLTDALRPVTGRRGVYIRDPVHFAETAAAA